MGIIDVILLIIIAVVAFRGFLKGLVMEVFGIIALFVAFLTAYRFSAFFAGGVSIFGFSDRTNSAFGYVLAFLLSYIVVILIGIAASKMFKEVKLGWLNQGGGAVFGGLKSAALCGVFLSFLLSTLPSDSKLAEGIAEGSVSGKLANFAPTVFDIMNKIPEVKRENPFVLPEGFDEDAVQDAVEEVKETAETMKDAADKASEAQKAAEKLPLKDLEDEFQKN